MSTFSPLVPGGGLIAHEMSGGHTIARHVALTETQLAARIATENLAAASCFTDLNTAEMVIAEALLANQQAIDLWLNSHPTSTLRIRYNANRSVGIRLIAGSNTVISASKILILLNPDPNSALGYYILTAYP